MVSLPAMVTWFRSRRWTYERYPLKWSVLDTFDTYATELESRHRPKEVFRWFREAGLTNIDLLDSEDGWVSVRGRAPARSSLD
jgi:hypothetical protein